MPPVYFSSSLSSQFHPFFCPTKTAIHPWHLEVNKTSSENANPAQKCHRSRDFCLKILSRSPCQSYFVFSFTEGSLFSIATVWERVRWRSGGELLASCLVGKIREWSRSARKSLTRHLYWPSGGAAVTKTCTVIPA